MTTISSKKKSLYSHFGIPFQEIKVGNYVWMSEEAADLFAAQYQAIDESFKLPKGIWKVIEKTNTLIDPITAQLTPETTVIGTVKVLYYKWSVAKYKPLKIKYNYNNDALIAHDGILIPQPLHWFFLTTKDLDQANSNKFDCVACSRPLNLFGMSYRVCNSCDAIMNGTSEELDKPVEGNDFFITD